MTQSGKPVEIDLARVRGVAFNAGLSSLPPAVKPRIQVALIDGSQLTGSGASREPGGPLRFTTAFGAVLEVPISAISSIRFLDGRTVWLSDIEPTRKRLVGFFGPSDRGPPDAGAGQRVGTGSEMVAAKDHNFAGGPLVVRGKEYAKGLGTRSRSEITFDLGGQYRHFQTLAALDDLAGGKGSVQFAVELDGVRVFTSAAVNGTSAPLVIEPIDVTGKQTLTLVVEYAELADVDDWADWCDAVVIR